MDLPRRLLQVPLWRPGGVPPAPARLTVACHGEDAPRLGAVVRSRHVDAVERVVLLDHLLGVRGTVTCEIPGAGQASFPVDDVASLARTEAAELLLFIPRFDCHRLLHASRLLDEAGVRACHVAMPHARDVGVMTAHRPDCFRQHEAPLRELYDML